MRELIETNPAHWKDEHALELLRALCRKAWAVVRDPVCRACLAAVDDYAAALPWRPDDTGWSPGRLLGPWVVRREVLRKLRLLEERLNELEKVASLPRQAVVPTPGPATPANERRRERYANALRRAAQSVGGPGRLALVLRVPRSELDGWLEGRQEAPLEAFLGSLDLLAAGPFVREGDSRPGRAVAARDVPPRVLPSPAPAAPRPFAEPFERALFALVVGAALIGAGGWVAYFRGTPGLAAAAGLAAWFCVAAALLARCVGAKTGPTAVQLALVGIALLFGAGMLFVPRLDRADVPVARPPAATPPVAVHTVALRQLAAAPLPAVEPAVLPPAPRHPVRRAAIAAPKSAAGGSAAPSAHHCSSLSGVASLQCLRCEHESAVQRWMCEERVRLQYCEGRDGTEAACPSVIPVSLPH